MNENYQKIAAELFEKGKSPQYVARYIQNTQGYKGDYSELLSGIEAIHASNEAPVDEKKKEELSVSDSPTSMGGGSITSNTEGAIAQEESESAGAEQRGDLTAQEVADELRKEDESLFGMLFPANPMAGIAGRLGFLMRTGELKSAEEFETYGGTEEYRKYFQDNTFQDFDSKQADAIAGTAAELIKQYSPQMIQAVNSNEALIDELKEIREEYKIGSTVQVAEQVTRGGQGGMYQDTVFKDVTVTEDMLREKLSDKTKEYLQAEYDRTIDEDVKSAIMDMIPERYKQDEEFLKYFTDKVFIEQEIDLDLDGNGRYKEEGFVPSVVRAFGSGTKSTVQGFADGIDYIFTGGDRDLARRRQAELQAARGKTMEFKRGISSSIANGDFANGLWQMSTGLAETLPIIGVTVGSAAAGAPALVGAGAVAMSGGGGAYTEALNDPDYNSDAGRFAYALASGVSDFAFSMVGGKIFNTASEAAQGAAAVAKRSAIRAGKKHTKDTIAAYARRKGLAIASEGFEEAATEVATSVVEAQAKGEDINYGQLMEGAIDAAILGGLAGPLFDGAGSMHGRSKALAYARANATSQAAVNAERDAAALRAEAEATDDLTKKKNLLKLADGLVRQAERAREARTAFYDMLQVRFPDDAKALMEMDLEIEALARQMNDPNLSAEAKATLKTQIEQKVKSRVDLERTFSDEDLNLSSSERKQLYENTKKAYENQLDSNIELLEMALQEHVDMEGTEAYSPDARAIAEKNLADARRQKEKFQELANEYREALEDLFEIEPTEGFDPVLLREAEERVAVAAEALAKESGISVQAFGGSGKVGAFLDVQDQITMRHSGQWLVDAVNGLDNSDLSRGDLEGILSSDNWAMLTGENPAGVTVGEASNAAFNERAEQYLKERGFKYRKIVGKYEAGENSFLVEGMTREQAAEFAAAMGQESVAHKDGLVQADGSINLFEEGGPTYGDSVDESSDYLSALKDNEGNVISFSFMPSDVHQDADGNTISSDDYKNRAKKNKADYEQRQEQQKDQSVTEELADLESELDKHIEREKGNGEVSNNSVEVPISEDGNPNLREGDAGLGLSEVSAVNNLVRALRSMMGDGVRVLIHPDTDSATDSGMSDPSAGGTAEGNVIHINIEAIREHMASLSESSEAKSLRDKTFVETLIEEVGHLFMGPAISKSTTQELESGLEGAIEVASQDAPMSKRIARKLMSYLPKEVFDALADNERFTPSPAEALSILKRLKSEGKISEDVYRVVLEEGMMDTLSAAAGPRGIKLGLMDQMRLWFENAVRAVVGVGDVDFKITDKDSFIKMVSKVEAMREGAEVKRKVQGVDVHGNRASKKINPTRIPTSKDGKIRVTTNIPIYKYDLGFKKEIGSEEVTKEFNDVWHFINWWKKATKMGSDDYYTGFRTEGGESIDVDRIKSYRNSSEIKTKDQSDGDLAIRKLKAASKQGLIPRVVERRAIRAIQNELHRLERNKRNNEPFADYRKARYDKVIQGVEALIQKASKELNRPFVFEEGSDFRRSTEVYLRASVGSEEFNRRYEEYAKEAEEYFGAPISNQGLDHAFLMELAKEEWGIDYDKDPIEVTSRKVAEAMGAVYDKYLNDPDLRSKTFLRDPLKFYENAKAEAEALISQMIEEGDLKLSPSDALIHYNILSSITSQQNDSDNNILSSSILMYESGKDKYNNELVSDVLISAINKEDDILRFGFVNGKVAKRVAGNLRKYNDLAAQFTEDGVTDFQGMLDFLNSPGKENQTMSQDLFGAKIGAFALNLNGSDNVTTIDSHVMSEFRVVMGRHKDFLEGYAIKRPSIQKEIGFKSDPASEMKALKERLHESMETDGVDSKRYRELRRMYDGAKNPPQRPVNQKERAIMDFAISQLSQRYGVEKRAALQLVFAAHQTMSLGALGAGYSEFASRIKGVREERLYKQGGSEEVRRKVLKSAIKKDNLSLAIFEGHVKTNKNVVGNKDAAVKEDEVRASSQLRLFGETPNQSETHPLYRERTVEEVGALRDGRVIDTDIVSDALNSDAASRRIIAKDITIEQGQKVGVRLNLNVLKNTGVPVQTVHNKTASGEAMQYSGAVVVKNPTLYVNQGARKKIFTFQENKFPMASVNGEFVHSDISQADFNGVKAFFNPFKQNVFVDASGRPIKSAGEATVIGNHVYLRGNIEYYDFNDPILDQGRVETEEERAKRVKRGPKYDKAVARFEAFSEAQGITFDTREDLTEAYDNMPIESKVALNESEVAENMATAKRRASRGMRLRRTAGRSARKYPQVRSEILNNPNNYFTPQVLKSLKADLNSKSDAELVDLMSNDGLGRLQNRNDDLGVLATAELINRAVARGDLDAVPDLIEEAAAIGTTAGRLLRHMRELKASSPRGIEAIIKGAVAKRGNTLTPEQDARLETMAGNLFRLQAEYEDLVRRAIRGEDVESDLEAKAREVKAAERELDTFANGVIERGWGQIGTMLIQGNLLTPMSQITNVGANMINAIGKVAVDAIALPVERLINAFGITSPMKRTYSINAYMYGIRKFGSGFMEALDSIWTGQEKDVSEWRVHRGFAPFRSLKAAMGNGDLPMGPDGQAPLSQRLKLFVQGTFGIPAEIMFRFLSLGDVPFRRYVEGIELYQAGVNQGLKGDALAQFIKHPTKKAQQQAEIEGRKLTYQEETAMSRMAEDAVAFFERQLMKGLDWIPGVDGRAAAKFLIRSNLPYVRTPANILMDTLTYVSPYVAGPRIMNDLKNQDARSAAQNFGKIVVGSMVSQTAVMLVKEGLISGAIEWNEDEEKNIAYDQFPPNSINVSGLQRWLEGGDTSKQADDYFISYNKLGVMGAIMGAIVKGVDHDEIKERDYEGLDFPIHALTDSFGVGAFSSIAYMMDQSFLQGMNNLVDVISSADAKDFEKNFENWFRTTFQAVSATAFPNTLSAVYRGTREYLPDTRVTKDMTLFERLTKKMEYTIRDRFFALGDVPVRINWKGQPITQTPRGTTGFAYQLFDITKARQGEADNVSNEIWRLYESTEDLTKVVGTPTYASSRKLNVPNIRKKHLGAIRKLNKDYSWTRDKEFMDESLYLSTEQMNRLMAASGKERYMFTESLIESDRYSKMDDEARVEALNEVAEMFNGMIEMDRSKNFRSHTKVLFDILQEIYDNERKEEV